MIPNYQLRTLLLIEFKWLELKTPADLLYSRVVKGYGKSIYYGIPSMFRSDTGYQNTDRILRTWNSENEEAVEYFSNISDREYSDTVKEHLEYLKKSISKYIEAIGNYILRHSHYKGDTYATVCKVALPLLEKLETYNFDKIFNISIEEGYKTFLELKKLLEDFIQQMSKALSEDDPLIAKNIDRRKEGLINYLFSLPRTSESEIEPDLMIMSNPVNDIEDSTGSVLDFFSITLD